MRHGTCIVACLVFFACGGGSGRSPTAPPPPLPNIAGTWIGNWAGLTVRMELTQPGGGSFITGNITVSVPGQGVTGPISGRVTSQNLFSWRLSEQECGSLVGDLQIIGNSMTGTATLDTIGCAQSARIVDQMVLSRSTAAALVSGSLSVATPEAVAEMVDPQPSTEQEKTPE